MAHDLVVVGGGPAGSTCARQAAQLGLDVLLLEKAVHPRRKACGGGLTLRVKETLDFDISRVIERNQCGLRLFGPSGVMVENYKQEVTGYTVRREDFDHLLLKKAEEAGALVIQGKKVTDVREEPDKVEIVTDDEIFKAKLLVGADGPNSTVGRKTGLMPGWDDDKIGLCIESAVPMDPSDIIRISGSPDRGERVFIEIHFGATPLGYAWAFPKRNEYSLGIGVIVGVMHGLKESWLRFVKEFEEKHGVKCDLSEQTAARVPLGGLVPNMCSKRVMLVGDAAGFVSPTTGEGIHFAIESSRIAAKVAHGIISGEVEVTTKSYEKQCRQGIGKDLNIARFLQKLLFKSTDNMERFIQMAYKDEVMKDHAFDLVMGFANHRQIRSRMTKRMLRKHPGQALRLIV